MPVNTQAMPILVCDDDSDILDMMHHLLTQRGFEVWPARGHADVTYYLEHAYPRLILLDIRMPEKDGFEIAEWLKNRGCSVPIIFLTAHDNSFSRTYAGTLGAVGYFTKPLDPDLLVKRISEILYSRSSIAS